MTRFTLLRVDMSRRTTSRPWARSADATTPRPCRPSASSRPEGKILAKIVDGELPHADRFREKLLAALPAN